MLLLKILVIVPVFLLKNDDAANCVAFRYSEQTQIPFPL